MRRSVQEIEFVAELIDDLARSAELFYLYLADVVLGNPDRKTHGNVLLAHRKSSTKFDLLPIDQSEAFFHPRNMLDETSLRTRFDDSGAEILPGMESVLLDGGKALVEEGFARILACKDNVGDFLDAAVPEWYEGAPVERALLGEFLEYRFENLNTLARKDYWLGLSDFGGDGVQIIGL
jgi:hypothetical protein